MREQAYAAVRAAYQRYLGRDASDDEIESHFGGNYSPASVDRAVGFVSRSPEAVTYQNRPATTPPPTPPPASSTTPPPGGNTATQAGTVSPNFRDPNNRYEGFNFDREQDTGKSAKDAYASLVAKAPPAPGHDKALLAAWFKQYIEPGMNALGHKVTSVDGDQFTFTNWQGTWTIDYARGAGAEGWAHAWQPSGTGAGARAYDPYKPSTPTTPAGTPPPPLPGTTPPDSPQPPGSGGSSGPPPPPNYSDPMTMSEFAEQFTPRRSPGADTSGDLYMSDLARQRQRRIGQYGGPA